MNSPQMHIQNQVIGLKSRSLSFVWQKIKNYTRIEIFRITTVVSMSIVSLKINTINIVAEDISPMREN